MSNIVDFAAMAASELESRFEHEPQGEFLAWLQLALRREAMVTVAYGDQYIRKQLKSLADRGLTTETVEIIHRALNSVWAQETGHQQYLASVLAVVNPPESFSARVTASCQSTLGGIEGRTIGTLVSGDKFARAGARLALALGSLIQDVPEFVSEIQQMPFEGFAVLNADLEETAIHGYERMLHLLKTLQGMSDFRAETTLKWDIDHMRRDETYHCDLFRFLAHIFDGPPPGGAGFAGQAKVLSAFADTIAVTNGIQAAQLRAYTGSDLEEAENKFTTDRKAIQQDAFVSRLKIWVNAAYGQRQQAVGLQAAQG